MVKCEVAKKNIIVVEPDKSYDFGACIITPVKLWHDVPQIGYKVFIGGEKDIYMTENNTDEGIQAKNNKLYFVKRN